MTCTWTRPKVSGSIPQPRAGHTVVLVDNKLMLWGGGDGENYLNDLSVFDVDTASWTNAYTAGTSPCARSRHSACIKGTHMYVIAGGGDNGGVHNDVYVLDTETMSWTRPPTKGIAPIARWGHSTTFVGDNLIVFGGHDGTRMLNDINILNTKTMTWSQPPPYEQNDEHPSPRAGHSATYVSLGDVNKLLIFGGGDGNKIYNDIYFLDLDDFKWSRPKVKGPLPAARCAHTADLVNGKLIVFGGGDGSRRFKDIYVLNTERLLRSHEPNRFKPKMSSGNKLSLAGKAEESSGDITCWLSKIGMARYADNFIKQEIDQSVLPFLTEDHLLRVLKIPTLGARIKIMNAIVAMRKQLNQNQNLAQASTQTDQPRPRGAVNKQPQRQVQQADKDDMEQLIKELNRAATILADTMTRVSALVKSQPQPSNGKATPSTVATEATNGPQSQT